MAKRQLGLGKAAKAKKQKTETLQSTAANSQKPNETLRVELNEEADADDELAQLQALWNTYSKLDKENELMVNGIIHECDRLLRNWDEKNEALPDYFHAIYALALSELAKYKPEETSQCFQMALERLDAGLAAYPKSIDVNFAKSRVLLARIPLQYISTLEVSSQVGDYPNVSEMLDEALSVYEVAETEAEARKEYSKFNEDNLDILQALDDVLDMVDNFCKKEEEEDEEKEDDDDEEEDEEEEVIQLAENHPLYHIQATDKYNFWWRNHTLKFLTNVTKRTENTTQLQRELCTRLGQSYLQEAEVPANVYTTLKYDDDYAGLGELQGLQMEEGQKLAQESFKEALKYLKKAQDDDDPDTWVNVAEAMISLGNMYEMDSPDQEKWYDEAEKILVRANKATQGKYREILENLRGEDEGDE
ncbi:inhibitor of Brome mosaic virus [Naganishia cerealis]|uniref:Inhibitor of Brome mosaic virus n=1 Tax=Naganishia cerealis TaxID=610337 RepID=A0ACC2UVV9_9TREE|nr:inhibitor of Brome mosaic virus [Naganishia cerealis]